MPLEDRVGLNESRDALEQRAAEGLAADRKTLPLRVSEPETTAAEHLVEDPVFLPEVLDRLLLRAVQKTCQDRDGEREGRAGAAHCVPYQRHFVPGSHGGW
jgi:hypothetical protein